LDGIRGGAIRAVAIETVAPSPLSHEILNSNPYTYLDDAPLEERRARAVSLRQTAPDLAGGLGALDAEAIAEVERQAWPVARDPDELHDVLLTMGVVPRAELERAGWMALATDLLRTSRATWATGLAEPALVAAERVGLVRLAFPQIGFEPAMQEPLFVRRVERTEEEALRSVVGGWIEAVGPVTVPELAARMAVAESRVAIGLGQLEQQGVAMRGRYRPGATEEEWCERALLARIHRMTLGRLRREIEPVTAADFMRFLFRWQHVQPGTHLHGRQGLLEIVGQLQGVELPARAWEAHVLPARIARYDPDDLEQLCLAGAVTWGRLRDESGADDDEPEPRRARTPNRAAPLAFVLRDDLPWLLAPHATVADPGGDAQLVLEYLRARGASFTSDVARGTRLLPAAVEEALWTLVASGLVTGDGIAGLRALIEKPEESRRTRRLHMLRGGRARLLAAGRWSLLREAMDESPGGDVERFAHQWLRRCGVVMRELLARETRMPPWWQLVRVLRTLEARGQVRGGRFVAGMVGEQFALPEAVEALRAVRRRASEGETMIVAAGDPLNLSGIVVPGPRIAPASHDVIAFRDGAVVETGELGAVRSRLGQRTARA
jgi:ATP-dependent Lhr-like helicase